MYHLYNQFDLDLQKHFLLKPCYHQNKNIILIFEIYLLPEVVDNDILVFG